MERSNLSIHGNNHEDSRPRVEIVLGKDGRPELLHDSSGGGRFAQVIRGFVGAGKLPQSIAIKLERHDLDAGHGSRKFDTEFQVQQHVHQGVGLAERSRVVRMIQMFSGKDSKYCDQLDPTLICPSSKSIIAPLCPNCRLPLRHDLACRTPDCHRATTNKDPEGLEKIRLTSCCGVCPGKCPDSYWLNQRACKIVLYELLDVDAQDYMDWRWGNETAESTCREGWRKFVKEHLPLIQKRRQQLHEAKNPELLLAYEEWRMVLNLFSDVTAGVLELHKKNVCHLDLKPANLGLILDGARASLKILDLGHAHHPSVPWSMLHQSRWDDAESQRTDSPYWAPEQSSAFVSLGTVTCERLDDRRVRVAIPHLQPNCSLFPGDYIQLRNHDYLEVTSAGVMHNGRLVVEAKWPESPSGHSDRSTKPQATKPSEIIVAAYLLQGASYNTDIYAIGLLLIQFVARGGFDVKVFQSDRHIMEQTLRKLVANEHSLPARVVVDKLLQNLPAKTAALFQHLLESLPQDVPELHGLVKELIGIGLRACCRGIKGFSYVHDRGDRAKSSLKALEQLRSDVAAIQDLLSILLHTQDLQFGRVFSRRMNCVQKLIRWLAKQPKRSNAQSIYNRDLIRNALDGLNTTDDEQCQREFRWLLDTYDGNTEQLKNDVILFRRELEAGVTITPLHPVMANMFGVLNSSENMSQEQRAKLEQLHAKWQVTQKQMQAAILKLNELLACLKRQPKLAWLQAEVDALDNDIKKLELSYNEDKQVLSRLETWFTDFQNHRKESISGWFRLADSPGWRAYGNHIVKQISSEQSQTKEWLDDRIQSGQLTASYSQKMRASVVEALNDSFKSRYESSVGRWRKWLSSLFGIPPRAIVKLNAEQVTSLEQNHQQICARIQTVPPNPFSKFLTQNT